MNAPQQRQHRLEVHSATQRCHRLMLHILLEVHSARRTKTGKYEEGPGDIVELENVHSNYGDLLSANQIRCETLSTLRCRAWGSRHSSFGENTNPLSTLSGPHEVPTSLTIKYPFEMNAQGTSLHPTSLLLIGDHPATHRLASKYFLTRRRLAHMSSAK